MSGRMQGVEKTGVVAGHRRPGAAFMMRQCLTAGFLCITLVLPAARPCPASAEDNAEFKGTVTDVAGRPVDGARIFVYNSIEVHRSANFLSGPTDKEGRYRMVLTPGKYWVVARLKKGEGYGPLSAGDKHSGEPREIDIAQGVNEDQNFIVADLSDVRKTKKKDDEGLIKISGRVLGAKGAPLKNVYAFASRSRKPGAIPDYLSAWCDGEGSYTLYVPRGAYFIGAATGFPPERMFVFFELQVETDKSGVDIIWKDRTTGE